MKEMYFVYNSIIDRYIFVEGRDFFRGKRREWQNSNKSELLERLVRGIDVKRKSVLHLKNIPKETLPEIRKFFHGTKVKLDVS